MNIGLFTGGDWPVFFRDTIIQSSWFPQVWSSVNGNGFGQNVAFVLGYKTFFILLTKFFTEVLFLPWEIVEKVIFFIPFWVLAFLSSYFLSRYFIKQKTYNFITCLVFATNTYSLMLIGGGQMGVAIAYAFSPFVFLSILRLFDKASISRTIQLSLMLGILLLVDPRIAGVILGLGAIFLMIHFKVKIVLPFLVAIIASVLLNSFWVLPFMFSGTGGLTQEYTSADILYFLSFAKLENTIALLHPNWPENFFGKVSFMRAEFLLLPILAFSVFLFKTDMKVRMLGVAAVLGIFLSKGVNEPFGQVYYFLSDYIPAFTMFRDATKWYLMIIIPYSILIPLSLKKISDVLFGDGKKTHRHKLFNQLSKHKHFNYVFIIVFLIIWGVTIRQLFVGQMTGTYQSKDIPDEYIQLEKLLSSDHDFSRVLWVPQLSRFGYFSDTHPAVSSYDLITSHDVNPTISYLQRKDTQDLIKHSAIKYVVVPYDSVGEIYLTDRKYDQKVYKEFIERVKKTSWLVQDTSFKKIGVFKVNDSLSHAYVERTNESIKLNRVSATQYQGSINPQEKSMNVVFSESFDSNWRLKSENQEVLSQKYMDKFNSFKVPAGVSNFEIVYVVQKWVVLGVGISFAILLGILSLLYIKVLKK